MNNNDLDKKTERIDKLINKTNSGKNSWLAGKLLHEIKEKQEYKGKQITSFEIYTRRELNISETKAYSYIKIYLTYEEDDIGDLMLVTHLIYLAEQNQNIREKLVKALREIDTKKINRRNTQSTSKKLSNDSQLIKNEIVDNQPPQSNEKQQKEDLRPDYDKDILTTGINLLNSAERNGIQVTDELATDAINVATEINQRNLENLKLPNKTGRRMESAYFPTLCELFEFEPISEMGLVSLFCTMLHLIKDIKFKFNKKTDLYFKSVQYVRVAFPDAAIKFVNEKSQETILNVEFELNTTNFLLHEHNKSDKECHLIIAWENDLNKSKIEEFGQKIPPIISIRQVIETGQINLY